MDLDDISPTPSVEELIVLLSSPPLCDENRFFESHWEEYEIAPEDQDAIDWVFQTHHDAIQAYQRTDYSAAIQYDREALKVFPEFAEAYIHLATVYQRLERWDDCLAIVSEAEEQVTEESPWLHYFKGRCLYEKGALDLALVEFQKEVAVVGASEKLLRWFFQVFTDQLNGEEQGHSRVAQRRLSQCALVCGFRCLKARFDQRLASALCNLWDAFERTGSWTPQLLERLTGYSRHEFNEFYRSFKGR
jgi:tetratricopeptide (TPR) repeat protein